MGEWVEGINIQNNRTYICYNPANYVIDTFSGNYSALGYTNANVNRFIKTLGYDEGNSLITLPTMTGGDSSSYTCDYYYQNSGKNTYTETSAYAYHYYIN
jgi:hypothetical protein